MAPESSYYSPIGTSRSYREWISSEQTEPISPDVQHEISAHDGDSSGDQNREGDDRNHP